MRTAVKIAINLWKWLVQHTHVKAFWYFLFDRKQLIRTPQQLDIMHRITKEYRSTGSLQDRLWRLAAKCITIANPQ